MVRGGGGEIRGGESVWFPERMCGLFGKGIPASPLSKLVLMLACELPLFFLPPGESVGRSHTSVHHHYISHSLTYYPTSLAS